MNRRIATLSVLSALSSVAASASAQTVPEFDCRDGEDRFQVCDADIGIAGCIARAEALDCTLSGRCAGMTRLPCPSQQSQPGMVVFCCTACAPVINPNIPRDEIAEGQGEDAKRQMCTPVPIAGGGGGVNGDPCDGELTPAENICNPWASPIIFDLGDRGYDLTSVDKGVQFDIDGDGAREQVSWTERGSDDAFLALDRNGNGQIDGAGELFGNFTKLANGKTSAHGYIPLAELDHIANGGNGNGYFDSTDRDFGTLLLWTDRDHDGRSQSAELVPLAARGIFAIALDADESDVVDEHGNHLAYVSPAYAVRGFGIHRIRTTDVFFRYRELARR